MAFSVGAIEGSLRINLQQFMDGLRQAAQQAHRAAAELTATLHAEATVDTSALTQGVARAVEQAEALLDEATLALEFDVTEAEQAAFGFLRNLEAIQGQARQVGEAATQVQTRWQRAFQSLTGGQRGLQGFLQATRTAWSSAVQGAQAFTARVSQAVTGTTQLGEAGQRAGERGASGMARFGREVVSTAKGFVLAQAGIASVQQALAGLQGFLRGVVDAVGEQEQAALSYAMARVRASKEHVASLAPLIARYEVLENQMEAMAREAGVQSDALKKGFNLATDAGLAEQAALQGIQTVLQALQGQFFGQERQARALREAWAVFNGEIEQADRLVQLWGRDAVAAFSAALRLGDVNAALAIAQRHLKLTGEEAERLRRSVMGVRDAYEEAWQAIQKSAAGKRFTEEHKKVLQAFTKDIEEHGAWWRTTTGLIDLGTLAMKGFAEAVHFALDGVRLLADPLTTLLNRIQEHQTSGAASTPLFELPIGRWLGLGGEPPAGHPGPTAPATTPGSTIQRPTAEAFAQATQALERHKTLNDALLQTEQARLQAGLERLRLAGDETQLAQAEAGIQQARLAGQRRANAQELADIDALLTLHHAKGDAETSAAAQSLTLRRDVLVEQQKALGAESAGVALAGQRATLLARIAQFEGAIRDVGQVTQAQAERTVATLRVQYAGEADLLQARQTQQQAQLDTEEHGLRTRQAELAAAGALSTAERERLDRALQVVAIKRQTLELTTQEALQTARVTRELALLAAQAQLHDTRLQGHLERWDTRAEQDALHVRMLGLTAAHESQVLTLLQAASKERQTLVELERVRQQSAELAADFQLRLQTTARDHVAAVTAEYLRQQTALDQQGQQLVEILQTLGLITREAQRAPALSRAREFAESLSRTVTEFQQSLSEGALDVARFVRGLGQSFIDHAMKPLMEAMLESLTRLMQSISAKLGSWGGLITAGIGVALVGVASLFNQQKAEVEALGEHAKADIVSLEKTRGLIAGDTSIPIQRLSEDLGRAMRPTNALISEGNRLLAQIAAALGQATAAPVLASTGGSYGITIETLSGERY